MIILELHELRHRDAKMTWHMNRITSRSVLPENTARIKKMKMRTPLEVKSWRPLYGIFVNFHFIP